MAEARFDEGEMKRERGQAENDDKDSDDNRPSTSTERHISIQSRIEDLEALVDLNGAGRKACPLCPEEKFKSCYSHKLRRHLQNLHWKVYVEVQGQRMCICHLPCRALKPSPSSEQSSSRHVAHYHCVVCSGTIARKTDMISHLKRHSNKGETQASYSLDPDQDQDQDQKPAPSGQTLEILKELGTNVQLMPNHNTPQKSDTYFSRKMKTNRQLVFCSLAVLAEERSPLECLDAFGATGIMGLQWAKHLRSAIRVTITDISDACVNMIRENCELNQIRVAPGSESGPGSGPGPEGRYLTTVEVNKMDANVILHLRPFDYVHLDPFGSAVNFLDSAFRNVRNHGVVSVTSTDTGSLYAKSPNVTLRHYGASLVRTEYYRELAARMVLDAVARAAARCNKGIDVLLSVALEHFVLVVVRVLRGPSQADESVKRLRRLVHCQWCEERLFLKQGTQIDDTLPCSCHGTLPGKTAVTLGPLWSGPLFNSSFLRRMLNAAVRHSMEDVQPLLKTLLCECDCITTKYLSNQVECGVVIKTLQSGDETGSDSSGKRKSADEGLNLVKKLKCDSSVEHPPFYYSIHRHSIRGMNMPKLNKFLQFLTEAGFRVSRTHFDPTGVRTNADLNQFTAVLSKYSSPTGSKPGLNQD
ncbi:TRMT1-like protein isoform X2 [Eucyclogobius newberryi]|uniref:TRMT1-like protein isoform X2 n=1 Tax=Eucyclogobius newberryi TaxID=166745 RepID=UPI003B5A2FCF